MIVEIVTVRIRSGMGPEYERVFDQSVHMIAATPGYIGHQLLRCQEVQDQYIVVVQWETLLDHLQGFNQSPEYQRWKALIHPFYDAPSRVEHFDRVSSGGRSV